MWLVCGEFNEILDPAGSSNRSLLSSIHDMRDFSDCLSDIVRLDMAMQGLRFTWY